MTPSCRSPSEAITQTVWSNGDSPGGSVGVEQAAHPALGIREADRGRQALAQRAGGDLHPRGVLVLRVARGQRTPGPQRLQVLQFQTVAGEEQLDVQGQRRVPRGQDEPVTARASPDPSDHGASASGTTSTRPEPGSSRSPGGRCPTFSTASAASTRTVSTARWSKSVHDSSCSSKCGTKTGPLSVLTAGGTLSPARAQFGAPLRFVPAVHHRNVDLSFRRRCSARLFRQCRCPCALI